MLIYRMLDKPLAQRGIFLPRYNPNRPVSKENFRTFHDEHIVAERLLIDLGINPGNAFFVDIGAGDGIDMSNTYLLAQAGSKGISVEFNPSKFGMLSVTYRDFPQVNLARCAATPSNIGDLLRGLGAPKNINFLSLDIDSFDYYVLESILEEFTLDIACLEINPAFPLSVDFSVTYPNSEWRGGLFQGMSLSMAYKLLSIKGYSIVHIDRACLFAIRATSQAVDFPSLTIHQAEEKLIKSLQDEATGITGERR